MIDQLLELNVLEVWIADNLAEGADDVNMGKDEFSVENHRGLSCVLGGMVQDIKKIGGLTMLNTKVQKVQCLPGDVKVTVQGR